MKQSDIITIVLITMIGTIAAGFAVNAIMGNPDDASETWKTITVVEPSVTQPNPDTFNADAINPTVEVYVGNCVDQDKDGKLSDMERVACGWRSSKRIVNGGTEEQENGASSENGSSSSESGESSNESSSGESGGSAAVPSTVEEIIKQREAQAQKQTAEKTDAQRKTDMSKFIAQTVQYRANNRGNLPSSNTEWDKFLEEYMKAEGEFKDPSGVDYTVDYDSMVVPNALTPDGVIHVYQGAECTESGQLNTKAADDDTADHENWYALLLKTESTGYYCADNHTSASGGATGQ